jgi:predicted lipoprotein
VLEQSEAAVTNQPDVVVSTGPVFGNAVRDGSGAFAPEQYPNSGDFNALSAELNKLVKLKVFPMLRERATVGSNLHFVGVAEVTEDDGPTPLPLRLVPVLVEFR